jgi:hypothetical protein
VSVFLYVAIVVIWLFILIPRRLRRSRDLSSAGSEEASYQDAAEDDFADGDSAEGDFDDAGESGSETQSAPVRQAGRPQVRRSQVLQARRRLLTILLLLTAIAGACFALKLTSWWVGVPPAVMLGGYVLLLREAAKADAELARRRETAELRAQAARQRAREERLAEEERYSAQIIDISARIGDQLYDQYADATVRAVGD